MLHRRHCAAMNTEPLQEDPEAGSHYRTMARAIRFLAENYADQPRLEDAAQAAGLSPFHFQRVFTRYVGVSPKNFVGNLTLDRAKAELAAGSSVLDAALEAGLSGPSRLHDLCIKIEAMTPGDYARGGAGLVDRLRLPRLPVRHRACDGDGQRHLCGLAFGDEGEEPRCSPT
jgi:AraC family transcriptional regulator of adaptative response/methylated-DNA-[protein]-cysteine methyltransferase